MDNKELEKKIKELLKITNYFDFVIAAKGFNKEYKKSDFYKQTHYPLRKLIKEVKIFYTLQLNDFFDALQSKIDGLDFDNVNDIINKLGDVFSAENADIMKAITTLKDLM